MDLKYKLNIQFYADPEPEPQPDPEPKTFTQEDINNVVKATKVDTENKLLKDLGIEDIETFKTAQKQKDEELLSAPATHEGYSDSRRSWSMTTFHTESG